MSKQNQLLERTHTTRYGRIVAIMIGVFVSLTPHNHCNDVWYVLPIINISGWCASTSHMQYWTNPYNYKINMIYDIVDGLRFMALEMWYIFDLHYKKKYCMHNSSGLLFDNSLNGQYIDQGSIRQWQSTLDIWEWILLHIY